MPVYAFFDFDGTLIAKDSFKIILKKALKQQPWRLLFLLPFCPLFLCTILLKLNKTTAKSIILWSMTVFRGKKGTLSFLKQTMEEQIDKIWFLQACEELNKLRAQNIEIIVVSASGTSWIRYLLKNKFKNCKLILGSKLGFFWGGLILKSKNCYQEEKIRRIHEILGTDFIWHSTYSDHIADLPILKKANLRYVVCPKKKHIPIFDKELNHDYTLLKWNV